MRFFKEMISRWSLRSSRTAAATGTAKSGTRPTGKATPFQVAQEMRQVGPTRIQDHDFLHVFEGTKKPEISGPLAIGEKKLNKK